MCAPSRARKSRCAHAAAACAVTPGPPLVPFQFTMSFSEQPDYIQNRLQKLRDHHVEWSTPFFFLNVDTREWPETVSLPPNEWRKCKYFDT